MALAQRLYEGLNSARKGLSASSPTCAPIRSAFPRRPPGSPPVHREKYGAAYLPENPIVYKSRKTAQEAHEAIRPTSLKYDPETVKRF